MIEKKLVILRSFERNRSEERVLYSYYQIKTMKSGMHINLLFRKMVFECKVRILNINYLLNEIALIQSVIFSIVSIFKRFHFDVVDSFRSVVSFINMISNRFDSY